MRTFCIRQFCYWTPGHDTTSHLAARSLKPPIVGSWVLRPSVAFLSPGLIYFPKIFKVPRQIKSLYVCIEH
jgi:hypothetical protein